jgi:hypothetical protein
MSVVNMSTLIGSDETSIYMEPGLMRIKVGGYSVMEITDPNEGTNTFALKQYVDD